ncbi:HlyD family secretion protein [Desulfoluna butyratoxydans]|uniref:Rnd efflux pump membrane fusion protein barrel-sandwich domain n=1 Tax=Desulfoluna butyratoxydans TaxID=231438 RepID=A0A4U8YPY5_9BACT|nr:efflux RND transporter periplasmic adaptor subunit [Desulfoluna butyratoxydans]VFQ45871.1 rnd efflux pump membrane fusion protein barrel-sandwich domain [Desulfoluna butyratoxydans]
MKKPYAAWMMVLVGLAATVGAVCLLGMNPAPLVVQGEVDATRIDVASKVPGRVSEVLVARGERVAKGQPLFVIDSPEIRARVRQARAAVEGANAQLTKANRGAREEEVRAARNLWRKAEAGLTLAKKTHARVAKLHADGVLPAQKLDEAFAQLEAARRSAEAARAAYEMAEKGAREEDKEAALAMVSRASGALAEAEAFEEETRLAAPRAAEVSDIVVDPGELAATGCPVVTLVDLADVWVTFNLREDLLAGIRMGSTLRAEIPALGNREVTLTVNHIAALGAFATWHATKATGDFDMKTFEVRAVPEDGIEGLRPGMSAVVTWDMGS